MRRGEDQRREHKKQGGRRIWPFLAVGKNECTVLRIKELVPISLFAILWKNVIFSVDFL